MAESRRRFPGHHQQFASRIMEEDHLKPDKLREMSILRKKAHTTFLKKSPGVYEAFLNN
jgi:hypothetical protein